jgi:hypothetical protein
MIKESRSMQRTAFLNPKAEILILFVLKLFIKLNICHIKQLV